MATRTLLASYLISTEIVHPIVIISNNLFALLALDEKFVEIE